MTKHIKGKCKLFESDGTTFICDAHYRISVHTDSSGKQSSIGYLYNIDIPTLASLVGKEDGILKLEDGQELKYAAMGMDPLDGQLNIRVHSVIKL